MKNEKPDPSYVDIDQIKPVTTFAPDTEFDGELHFTSPLKIDGKFKGKIVTKGFLEIGSEAHIEGEIIAGSVKLGGTLRGNIHAGQKVELLKSAKLYGNIKTTKLKIADGVLFEGHCEMIS